MRTLCSTSVIPDHPPIPTFLAQYSLSCTVVHSSGRYNFIMPPVPQGWPSDIIYLSKLQYSRSVKAIAVNDLPSFQVSDQPSRLVKITRITQSSHPANGEYGLFAAANLPPNNFILFYLGYVHSAAETDPTSNYDLSLDRELEIGIDANKMGNEARFINDYRGIQPAANAEFRDVMVNGQKWIGVFVLSAGSNPKAKRAKGISKGEEILVSYGKGFWTHRKE